MNASDAFETIRHFDRLARTAARAAVDASLRVDHLMEFGVRSLTDEQLDELQRALQSLRNARSEAEGAADTARSVRSVVAEHGITDEDLAEAAEEAVLADAARREEALAAAEL